MADWLTCHKCGYEHWISKCHVCHAEFPGISERRAKWIEDIEDGIRLAESDLLARKMLMPLLAKLNILCEGLENDETRNRAKDKSAGADSKS